MKHFSYPLTIVQINIFEEAQNIFSQPNSQTLNYQASPPPRIFNYRVPPWERLYTCTCTILQETINGFLCPLIVSLESEIHQLNFEGRD